MVERTFFIAEAGVNHNGSLDRAVELIDIAADAGADAVKFQTFKAEKLATVSAKRAGYQVANLKEDGSQRDMLARLELSLQDHERLVEHCSRRGIRFMSTAFDSESLAFLRTLGMPAVKVPSGDITCGPLLLQASRMGLPIIVSTGMSSLSDIEAALGVLAFGLTRSGDPVGRSEFDAALGSAEGRAALRANVTLLHCVTQYPAPPESVNLRAMDTMREAFGLPVGYSDHTLGIEVSLAAVARGAVVIEKHFTVDRGLPGPDHAASLEPEELKQLVRGIRTIEAALGRATKYPVSDEIGNRAIARRSLVASRPIGAGETITADALAFKRPGGGLSPMAYWDVVGRTAPRRLEADDPIEL